MAIEAAEGAKTAAAANAIFLAVSSRVGWQSRENAIRWGALGALTLKTAGVTDSDLWMQCSVLD
jgi:hypothetical protein